LILVEGQKAVTVAVMGIRDSSRWLHSNLTCHRRISAPHPDYYWSFLSFDTPPPSILLFSSPYGAWMPARAEMEYQAAGNRTRKKRKVAKMRVGLSSSYFSLRFRVSKCVAGQGNAQVRRLGRQG
jgi:hypothetical protein